VGGPSEKCGEDGQDEVGAILPHDAPPRGTNL
jgi:hypothetical protein